MASIGKIDASMTAIWRSTGILVLGKSRNDLDQIAGRGDKESPAAITCDGCRVLFLKPACLCSGCLQGGFDQGGGQTGLPGARLGEVGLEAVTESHQFIDFDDDAVLFVCWGQWQRKCPNHSKV